VRRPAPGPEICRGIAATPVWNNIYLVAGSPGTVHCAD
ncbi:unnamed protein product, partial [Acidocella sp. C78]